VSYRPIAEANPETVPNQDDFPTSDLSLGSKISPSLSSSLSCSVRDETVAGRAEFASFAPSSEHKTEFELEFEDEDDYDFGAIEKVDGCFTVEHGLSVPIH
jgi:hypothetical protein